MNNFRIYILIAIVFVFSVTPVYSFAADTHSAAVLKIAEIMHRLKHFPSPVGKATLQSLASKSTTTSNERIIIQAMLNLQHQVSLSDKKTLTSLVNDSNARKDERSIATILLHLDHRPTKQDKVILKKILGN